MKENVKYVLYARKSTESEDRQIQSIDDQVSIMTDYAINHGLAITQIIRESRSAKQPHQREEFSRMIESIQKREANGIICWQFNRLSRNPTESGVLQQLLQDEVITAIHTFDRVYAPEDNALLLSVEASMSNQFVRDLMKNVRRGMRSKAASGWHPGVPPIGYKNHFDETTGQKIIVKDPERFDIVRRLWDLMLDGTESVAEITRIADTELGLRSIPRRKRGGTPMTQSGIYAMFHRPFYFGMVDYDGLLHQGKHEPMVTKEEYDRVQGRLRKSNAANRPKTRQNDPFPYRGLLRCGECGCAITFTRKTKTYKNGTSKSFDYCYCTRKRKNMKCSQSSGVSPDELTRQISRELKKYTIIPEFFDLAMECIEEFDAAETKKQAGVLTSLNKAIIDKEESINNLQRMLFSGRCNEEFFDKERASLEAELTTLRKSRESAMNGNREWRDDAREYFNFARYAAENFQSDDDGKKRAVLASIGQNLTLKDGRLEFEPIKYLVPVLKMNEQVERQKDMVGTSSQQRKKAAINDLSSQWYTRYDSNIRPLAPQANALSS